MFFSTAYEFTKKWEGDISDDGADHGGLTKYGISYVFLCDFVKEFPKEAKEIGLPAVIDKSVVRGLSYLQAPKIMKVAFWDKLYCGMFNPPFGIVLFNFAVNSGPARAVRGGQTACNQCMKGEPLKVDGVLGPKSRAAFCKADLAEGKALIAERKRYLNAIADRNCSQRVFLKGWLNKCNDLEKFIVKHKN